MKHSYCHIKLEWKKLLEQFLPSVVEHSKEAAVYVADNASTDDSIAFVKAQFSNCKNYSKYC